MTRKPHPAEEVRQSEKDAKAISAQIAADMLRRPRLRWALMPIYRLMKWVERQTDEWLKNEGWR